MKKLGKYVYSNSNLSCSFYFVVSTGQEKNLLLAYLNIECQRV